MSSQPAESHALSQHVALTEICMALRHTIPEIPAASPHVASKPHETRKDRVVNLATLLSPFLLLFLSVSSMR